MGLEGGNGGNLRKQRIIKMEEGERDVGVWSGEGRRERWRKERK